MSVRTIYDAEERKAVMYDSVTDTAFGPVFDNPDDVESYLEYVRGRDLRDVRQMSDSELRRFYNDWISHWL